MQSVRIFISSPGDVGEERERARQVIQSLRRRYAQHFELVPLLWEDMPLSLGASFQEGIDVVLSVDRGIDIAVFILWSRLGSALGPLVGRDDGRDYRSGTERELDLMLRAREANGGDRPRILAYARFDEATFEESLRGKTTTEKEELLRQKRLVEDFIQETFHDPATGANVRAYHTFHRPQTFGERLRVHLQEILDRMCEGRTAAPLWDIDTQGPPFRGLEPFRFEHAEIFFGREDEVLEARSRLAEAARRGTAFLLIGGASGTGKSSLAAAGLLPEIVGHELDDAVARWIPVQCTPATLSGDPAGGIARLLCAAIPSIADGGDTGDFALALARDPELAVKLVLAPALRKLARPGEGAVRVALLVDQLEELFTDARLTEAARESFTGILHALASSGQVWVVATIRGDFYPRLLACDPLVRLKSAGAQFDLLLPQADAIRRMIESPAALAGLRYETVGNASVADRILRDIASQAELLPLLEDFLRELFERRSPTGVLTLAAYESLGGIVGSLANRAEAAVSSLPADAQAALPEVLRQLVAMDESADGAAVRRRAPLASFAEGSPARRLLDRLVADRLATADSDDGGRPEVMIAHEAILRAWPRAAAWIAENGEFLRTRDRLTARMTEAAPIASDDPLLAAARLHLAAQPAAFEEGLRNYIREQFARIEAKRVRRERRRRAVVAGLAGLALCSMAAAGVAAWQWHRAGVARDQANASRLQAEGLVDTIVFGLWGKLKEAGRLDLLADSHGAVTAYYGDRIAKGDQDLPPASREEAARTVNRIVTILTTEGDLKRQSGDFEAAEQTIRTAQKVLVAAAERNPADKRFQIQKSFLNGKLADLLEVKGNTTTARALFEADIQSLEALTQDSDADQDLLCDARACLAFSHERLGSLLANAGDLEGAREHYQNSLDESTAAALLSPDDGALQRNVECSHGHVGDIVMQMGDLTNAHEHYTRANQIAETLAQRDRRNVQWQADLAVQASRLARLAAQEDDAPGECKHRERAIAVLRPLADADRTDTAKHGEVVTHAARVGFIAESQKDFAAARTFHEIALATARTVLARQPDDISWKSAAGNAHDSLGSVALAAGDLDAAKSEFESAVEIYQQLVASDPDNPSRKFTAGMAAARLGDVTERRGERETAKSHFEGALAIYEALPPEMREGPECLDAMSVAHSHLGDLAVAAGDMTAASLHRKQDLAFSERLAAVDTTNLRWQRGLALAVSRMGDLERDGGNKETAIELYRRALGIAVELTKKRPDDVLFLGDVAYTNEQLATLFMQTGDGTAALTHLQDATAARETVIRLQPQEPAAARAWCNTLSSLGDQLDVARDVTAARECFDRIHAVVEQHATRYPADLAWQGELAGSHRKLALRDATEGRLGAARARMERSVAILKDLDVPDGDDLAFGRLVADAEGEAAFLAILAMDLIAARGYLESAIDRAQTALEKSPEDSASQERLANAFALLANSDVLESNYTAARDHFSNGLRILEKMRDEDPANVGLRCLEAEWHTSVGDIEADENKNSDAIACYEKAMEILAPLAKNHPEDTVVCHRLAEVEIARARVFNSEGDPNSAQRSIDRAVGLLPSPPEAVGADVALVVQLAVSQAHAVRGDVAAARGDLKAALGDYAAALVPLTPFLQDGRTSPAFAWMAVELHAGLQWLAEQQGDAFTAGQHKADLRLMVRRALAEAPQAAVMWMKQMDRATAGVLFHARVAIGEEVGRQLREAGDAAAATTCEEFVARWKKHAEDAAAPADTPDDTPAEAAASAK